MRSQWFDELDMPQYGDMLELKDEFEKLYSKWIFEFDTIENRKLMQSEFESLLMSHVSGDGKCPCLSCTRQEKLTKIL